MSVLGCHYLFKDIIHLLACLINYLLFLALLTIIILNSYKVIMDFLLIDLSELEK
jgi:hypothetical protein